MDNTATQTTTNTAKRLPLGSSSFGPKEQKEFETKLRLAMACIEGKAMPDDADNTNETMPSDIDSIRRRLISLSQDITSDFADRLELLVRYDELEGYKSSGANHCAAWMNMEIGISLTLAWEYLRVGRKLRKLPITTALLRAGKLSWSKIRILVNVANPDNEKILCHAALDAPVTDVAKLCNTYRWNEEDSEGLENDRALHQWQNRSLTWHDASNGNTHIRLVLPPEIAQAFLNSVEHSLNQFEETDFEPDAKYSQRRADAAVRMAENSLQTAGRDVASADRYQVIVSVNNSELAERATDHATDGGTRDSIKLAGENLNHHTDEPCVNHLVEQSDETTSPSRPTSTETKYTSEKDVPAKRPTVKGSGAIARETARRIACDCCITTNVVNNGEPTNIGRKSRLWTPPMARAIKNRDQHCQFYGCTQTYNLQIHHIKHWADGGTTCVDNGVCLCTHHHTMVHEGGYRIEKVDGNVERLDKQFSHQQQYTNSTHHSVIEKALRDDRQSFDKVRQLLPTRYKFRIVDRHGKDFRTVAEHKATAQLSDTAQLSGTAQAAKLNDKNVSYENAGYTHTVESTNKNASNNTACVSHDDSINNVKHSTVEENKISISKHTDADSEDNEYPTNRSDSTHVECAEPMPVIYRVA